MGRFLSRKVKYIITLFGQSFYSIKMKKNSIFLALYFITIWNGMAQVDVFSKQLINEVIVYKDIKDPLLYYYAPSKLQLVVDKTGKPDFKMLKMRYVGTQCSNDESESHTTNLVQLRIELPARNKKVLDEIKKKLRKNKPIKLRPIRITGIDSKLVAPLKNTDGTDGTTTFGKTNNIASEDKSGISTRKSYWTERVFTFSLGNHEASLLESQLKAQTLVLSFGYSFYADTTDPMDYSDISGATELVDLIKKTEEEEETSLINRVIFSDTFEINMSIDKWPDLILEIDINETLPPVYAAVEIKCYDFYENLRPDLYLKIVEVAATSVDGSKEIIVESKFYSKQPEINTKRIHFPYAVLVEQPFKYRITELNLEGKKTIGEWQLTKSCSELLNITTPSDKLLAQNETFEIEIDKDWFIEYKELKLELSYLLNEKYKKELLEFDSENTYHITSFYHDINSKVKYQIKQLSNDSLTYKSDKLELLGGYLYISKQ